MTSAGSLPLPLPLGLPSPRRRSCSAATQASVACRLPIGRGPPRATSSPPAARPLPKLLDDSLVEPCGVRDYIERSREMIRPDGGPPRWFSPLECGARGKESPLLLYLPGIDGTGLGLIRHHQRLGKIFDIWCLHVPVNDRISFEGLVEYVEKTIKSEESYIQNKPIYLIGESIGACLALAVAARNPDADLILILANPATSFSKSQLQYVSAFIALLPEPLHVTIPYFHSLITGSSMSISTPKLEEGMSLDQYIWGFPDKIQNTFSDISFLLDILPKESLIWKLDLLKSASLYANSHLHAVKAQTLILASGKDQLFPNHEEAIRIRNLLPNSRIRHFKESGHTIFLESGIDLVTILKGAGYYRRSRRVDYVSDYLLPTPAEFQKSTDPYRLIEMVVNPVMLSTLQDGKIVKGLDGIPSEGPAILVGYHMLMGLELGPLFTRLFTKKNIHLRGIAHPFLFDQAAEQLMPDTSSFDSYRLMGAVPVSATYFYKLLSTKSFVLLYPGGAREALHRKGEEYKLFWPERSEVIRMASRFGATIIPFGVVGEDDMCDVLLDYDDLVKIPFYDSLNKMINQEAVRVRTGYIEEVGNQNLHPPVILPKIPGRLYFFFGKPIETKGRREVLRDREQAQQLYMHVKSEVEGCISYLKEKREKDPYRHIFPRILYQMTHGLSEEVPTFDL